MLGQVWRRLRSRWDYLLFLLRHDWPVVIGLIGILVGLVTLSPTAVWLSFGGMLLGLATFGKDLHAAGQRVSRYQFVAVNLQQTKKVKPPPGMASSKWISVPSGTVLVNAAVDETLRNAPIAIEMEKPYKLPKNLRSTAPHALRIATLGSVVFNGHLLSLASDPPTSAGGAPSVRIRRTRYFDSLCSNELCRYRIFDRETDGGVDIRKRVLFDSDGRLLSIEASSLSNHIGVSTLAFTSDDQLIVCQQTSHNLVNRILYAPSGSGTIPPGDLLAADTLQDLLKRSMERELCEESGIRLHEIIDTRVIGYGRWLERGAKPEFFGVTRLSVRAKDVTGRRISGAERLYTARVKLLSLDLTKLGSQVAAGRNIAEIAQCPEELRESGSVSLLINLRAAALDAAAVIRPTT